MALCFAILNDLITSPEAFFKRMGHWIGGPGVENYNKGFSGHFNLFVGTLKLFVGALGWPLSVAVIAAVTYGLFRFRFSMAITVLPLIVYYVVIIMSTRLSMPRYYIPGFVGLMVLVGKAAADFWRWPRIAAWIRMPVILVLFGASLLYCIGLDLALVHDSRYQAEKFLTTHLKPTQGVIALSLPAYAPRLENFKSAYVRIKDRNRQGLEELKPYADFIVLSSIECGMCFDAEFLKSLLSGDYGYEVVAKFNHNYRYPTKTIYSFIGWPFISDGFVDPEITIMERTSAPK
jgi:hypothetical protein